MRSRDNPEQLRSAAGLSLPSDGSAPKRMMRLGLLFSHSVPKRLLHPGACRLCWLTASPGSGLLGDIIIPRAEPRGRQSR